MPNLWMTLRSLSSQRVLSVGIIVTLALGFAASITALSVTHAVLIRPLPFTHAERIVTISERSASSDSGAVSMVTFDDWRSRHQLFEEIAAVRYWEAVNLEDPLAEPEPVTLAAATENFFRVLGVVPLLGRTYKHEQSVAGGSEAVISHALWRRRYQSNPGILGQVIEIRGTPTTIVGVMPPLPAAVEIGIGDVWTCLFEYDLARLRRDGREGRRNAYLSVLGRVPASISVAQAAERMESLQAQLWNEPDSIARGFAAHVESLTDSLLSRVRVPFLVIASAGLVLLTVSCLNSSTLLLLRVAARRREMALRTALGATSRTLIQLIWQECAVLIGLGSAIGIALSWVSLKALAQIESAFPRLDDAGLSTPVVLLTTSLAVLFSIVLAGLFSADAIRVTNASSLLQASSARGLVNRDRRTFRLLALAQVGMACALLIATGLLLKSFSNVLSTSPGFDATGTIYLDLFLPNSRYTNLAAYSAFYRKLFAELDAHPSVEAAGASLYFPFKAKLWPQSIEVEGTSLLDGQVPVVYFNQIGGEYFRAMAIRLEEGRLPSEQEIWEANAEPVVVVNRSMAQRLFGERRALGRRFRTEKAAPWTEIIGVVSDVRQRRLDIPPAPEYYATFRQMPMPFQSLVVRGRPGRALSTADVKHVVAGIDPGLALANLMPLTDWVRRHTRERQFALMVLGIFAVLALVMGVLSVYGAVSVNAIERKREMSIRLAFGASAGRLRRMMFIDGMTIVLVGNLSGVALALATAPSISRLLYNVGRFDITVFAGVPALLVIASLAACWWPARAIDDDYSYLRDLSDS